MQDKNQSLLATKKENYETWKYLKVGDVIVYKTKRTKIINKLNKGDVVYIKVQTDGYTRIKTEVVKTVYLQPKRAINLKIIEHVDLSTRYVYKNWVNKKGNPIKAGSEHSWIKDKNAFK